MLASEVIAELLSDRDGQQLLGSEHTNTSSVGSPASWLHAKVSYPRDVCDYGQFVIFTDLLTLVTE